MAHFHTLLTTDNKLLQTQACPILISFSKKKPSWGGLTIVLKSPRGGLTGCILHCVNEKKNNLGESQKNVKNRCGWSEKQTSDIPPNTYSNGIARYVLR